MSSWAEVHLAVFLNQSALGDVVPQLLLQGWKSFRWQLYTSRLVVDCVLQEEGDQMRWEAEEDRLRCDAHPWRLKWSP